MLGKQSRESVESVLRKKKKKATVKRICRKEQGFKPGIKKQGVMDDKSGESMEPMGEVSATHRRVEPCPSCCRPSA